MTPVDLSYLTSQPSEAQEQVIKDAVAAEILGAIITYLTELADLMDSNNIASLNSATVRAMAAEFANRLSTNE
jgi:hypothetical protein